MVWRELAKHTIRLTLEFWLPQVVKFAGKMTSLPSKVMVLLPMSFALYISTPRAKDFLSIVISFSPAIKVVSIAVPTVLIVPTAACVLLPSKSYKQNFVISFWDFFILWGPTLYIYPLRTMIYIFFIIEELSFIFSSQTSLPLYWYLLMKGKRQKSL